MGKNFWEGPVKDQLVGALVIIAIIYVLFCPFRAWVHNQAISAGWNVSHVYCGATPTPGGGGGGMATPTPTPVCTPDPLCEWEHPYCLFSDEAGARGCTDMGRDCSPVYGVKNCWACPTPSPTIVPDARCDAAKPYCLTFAFAEMHGCGAAGGECNPGYNCYACPTDPRG